MTSNPEHTSTANGDDFRRPDAAATDEAAGRDSRSTTSDDGNSNRPATAPSSPTRRAFLTATATGLAGVAGCLESGGSSTPTTEETTRTATTSSTSTTTAEPTTTEVQEKSFAELYDGSFPADLHGLRVDQQQDYRTRIEEEEYESFSHLLSELNTTISNNVDMSNDSQELTRRWKAAVHNDLEVSSDEIRVMGRDTAGGGTYTAIFHRTEDGDWVKDLALPSGGDGSYLRHDESKDQVDFNDEAERALWNFWKFQGTDSATWYDSLKDDLKGVASDTFNRVIERVSKGNDHIVVADNYDIPAVGYTTPAAKRVADIMNWHENKTFNEEMVMVEQATEAYHNSDEQYLKMEMVDGELNPTPTEEYTGPENLYSR